MTKYRNIAEFINSKIPECLAEVKEDDLQMFLTAEQAEDYLREKYPNCWEERWFDIDAVGEETHLYYDYWEGDPNFMWSGETSAYYLTLPHCKHRVIVAYWEVEEDYSLQIGDSSPVVVAHDSYTAMEAARSAKESEIRRGWEDEGYTPKTVTLTNEEGDIVDF